jgi:hypothetical protein
MSSMGRREFVALLGGAAAAWPLAVRAQQKMLRVGFVGMQPREFPVYAASSSGWLNWITTKAETSRSIMYKRAM